VVLPLDRVLADAQDLLGVAAHDQVDVPGRQLQRGERVDVLREVAALEWRPALADPPAARPPVTIR
jgi:hypothetical protein